MYTERRIVAIAGPHGTGKTALSSFLVAERGFTLFEGSTALETEAARQGITFAQREDFGAFHGRLQKERGKDILYQLMLEIDEPDIVFSGIRTVANAERVQADKGILLALQCPAEIALPRMPKSAKTPQSLEEYWLQVAGDNKPEFGIDTDLVVSMADYTLDTSKPFKVTCLEMDRILDDVWPNHA